MFSEFQVIKTATVFRIHTLQCTACLYFGCYFSMAHNKFRNCIDKFFLMVKKASRSYADIKKDFKRLKLI